MAANEGRYTWRHNAVLKYLANSLQPLLTAAHTLYVDVPGYCSPSVIFDSVRPDLVLRTNNNVTVIELTCCYEQNIEKSIKYKLGKYGNLENFCRLGENIQIRYMSLEITSLGFINSTGFKDFCKISNLPLNAVLPKLAEISLRCLYFIFCLRHKPWPIDLTDPYIC